MDITATSVGLNNGVEMPRLGIGVWQTPAGHDTEDAVRWALEAAHEGSTEPGRSFAQGVPENVERLKRHISESREPERLAEARAPSRPRPSFGAAGRDDRS